MNELSNVTAVILAGGLGTRLRSVVWDRPKVLAEILSRPFLSFLLDQLESYGVRNVVICIGYKGEEAKNAFGEKYGNISITYSQESSLLGTAGALRLAYPLLNSENVLVLNGDSYCHVNLSLFWKWQQSRLAIASLVLMNMSETKRYGSVYLDSNGYVTGFFEKGENESSGLINTGIYILARSLILEIPESQASSLEREIFPSLIGRGLSGYLCDGPFIDIGTPESYKLANQFFQTFPVKSDF